MKFHSTRRSFLSAGLAIPAAGLASATGLGKVAEASAPAPPLTPAQKLAYRILGKTGLKVTTVGFGCMVTSDASVIERAADIGINYFDTARFYQSGNNERMVGVALKKKRKDVILSSKTLAPAKEEALKELDTSLSALGTDYLDIWYLHSRDKTSDVTDELFEAQQTAKKQGKIRFAGLSTHNSTDMVPLVVGKGATDVVMLGYNFSIGRAVDVLIEQATSAGIGVVGMKAMMAGFRVLKPESPIYSKFKKQGTLLAALKWGLANPMLSTIIPGMTDMDQLEENLRAMAEPYTQADEALLAQQHERISPIYCRMCGACEGTCVKNLPVANMLRYLSYADGYGQFALGREHFLALPPEVTSVRCNNCSKCTVACPFGVKVASRLARAQELFA